jgi:CheY-like chemotaxis protein
VLEKFGYTVITAVDGEDAIAQFIQHKDVVQLFLTDLVMPKKSGKEAYDEIKKIKPGIKAIFTSGYSQDIVRDKSSLADRVSVIFKPVSLINLLSTMRKVLDENSHGLEPPYIPGHNSINWL